MDTEERLVQKAKILHKLDRLVQWFKSGLQNSVMLQKIEWTQESGLYRKQTFYINWTGCYNGSRAAYRTQACCSSKNGRKRVAYTESTVYINWTGWYNNGSRAAFKG
jgi:hypothetical protein